MKAHSTGAEELTYLTFNFFGRRAQRAVERLIEKKKQERSGDIIIKAEELVRIIANSTTLNREELGKKMKEFFRKLTNRKVSDEEISLAISEALEDNSEGRRFALGKRRKNRIEIKSRGRITYEDLRKIFEE